MKDNTLIVGAGLAGCLCAWELHRRKKSFTLINQPNHTNASEVAAGIINPVTGKRYILLDHFSEFMQTAQALYRDIENQLQQSFLKPTLIHRIFRTAEEHQLWNEERNRPRHQAYFKSYHPAGTFSSFVHDRYGSITFQGFVIDGAALISAFKTYFQHHLIRDKMNYEAISFEHHHMSYYDQAYQHIIFCEGYEASENPFFDWIPFKHAKGEILILETESTHQPDGILNFGKWLQPLGQNRWKAGSTFEWEHIHTQPSPAGRKELTDALDAFCPMTYHIIDHIAGVRPVVRDLKPLLGHHPEYPMMSIVNGLGAKGFLYAPTYVQKHINTIFDKAFLDPGLSVRRFFQI